MNQKILFVDDEPAALGLYRQMLKGEFDISTAVGGEDGIAMLRNLGPFAIVISDMKMPGMDGVRFLKRVRQLAPNTITLLLTGRVDLNGAVNAVNEGGIFRLLMKPCDESVLTEAINAALACYHQRKDERDIDAKPADHFDIGYTRAHNRADLGAPDQQREREREY